jgi:hypothetical protein
VRSSNGPVGRVSYPNFGVTTAICPFTCMDPSLYANQAYNACIPTPIGFYSPNGGQSLLPCRRTGITYAYSSSLLRRTRHTHASRGLSVSRSQFYRWTSGGTRNSATSCNGIVLSQALVIAPPNDLQSMAALNGSQFTLQVTTLSLSLLVTQPPFPRSTLVSRQMWIKWQDTYRSGDANSSAAGGTSAPLHIISRRVVLLLGGLQ